MPWQTTLDSFQEHNFLRPSQCPIKILICLLLPISICNPGFPNTTWSSTENLYFTYFLLTWLRGALLHTKKAHASQGPTTWCLFLLDICPLQEYELWTQRTYIQIPPLIFPNCVTLGKLISICESQFPYRVTDRNKLHRVIEVIQWDNTWKAFSKVPGTWKYSFRENAHTKTVHILMPGTWEGNGEIILNYRGGPNLISWGFKSRDVSLARGRKEAAEGEIRDAWSFFVSGPMHINYWI